MSLPSNSAGTGAIPTAKDLLNRLESVPFTRWHMRPRLIVGSATFFDAFDALSLAFVLPVLVPLWHIAPSQIGWLIAASYLGQFFGALIFGRAAEKFGRIRSISVATALMSVMGLACALSGSLSWLIALRFVQGIGVGGEMPVAAVYINELSKARGRGRFFMLYEMIFPIGLMITGQIGAVLVPWLGWQMMFVIGGIPGLIIAALLLRLPESPRWLLSKGRHAEAEAIIAQIEASTDERVQPIQVTTPGPARAPAAPSVGRWSELVGRTLLGRTTVVWTLWVMAYFITNGLNNWMPTLYKSVYKLPLAESLRAATFTNIAQVAILLVCAFVIDRLGRRRWTVTSFVAGSVLLAALGLFASHSVSAVILMVTVSYGVIGSVNAVLYLYTPEIYPTRLRALGTGTATCWLRLASAAGPLLVGYLVESRGTAAVFLVFAAAGVIGAVAATRMLETGNRRLEDIAQ